MPSPLTLAGWTQRTIVPVDDVTALESSEPGFIQRRLDGAWSWIMARLAKRYDVALMQTAPPDIVLIWLTALVTFDFYSKRGFNPSSESDKAAILDAYAEAKAEVKEAADAKDGLFDLPVLSTNSPSTSGVSRGFPLGYSETSPYVWQDVQAVNGSQEDPTGQGT